MPASRQLTRAAVAGAVAALAADVLLQGALSLVRVDGAGLAWLPLLLERGRWVMAAVLLTWVAPRIIAAFDHDGPGSDGPFRLSQAGALRGVGTTMIALPLLWVAASLVVRAVRLTLDGGWPYEGRVFVSGDFYSSLMVGYAPWALGGMLLVAWSRHADRGV